MSSTLGPASQQANVERSASITPAQMVWTEQKWQELDRETRRQALETVTEEGAWKVVSRRARTVLKTYSTSFFIVTRFLPPVKRAKVEAIYAAVRYPDEVVDTFPLTRDERTALLDEWATGYETALECRSLVESLRKGVPCFIAGFAEVVRQAGIPAEHYRAFLEAMRLDIEPRPFVDLDDLIDSYVYGSAIVVGYFLTYVYGAPTPDDFSRALESARDLGIALQLTNFLRDVAEDQRRGRTYLPTDMLLNEGIEKLDATDPAQHPGLNRLLTRLTTITETYYDRSKAALDAFNPDSRIAIQACIDVYRQLNARIANNPRGILHRESVPMSEKFRVLPASKYWRLPLAYLQP